MGSDADMDRTGLTTCGCPVITTDASGFGGGAWGPGFRYQFTFPENQQAPNKSSNWREFATILRTIEQRAPYLKNKKILVRTDNIVSMFIIQKQASMALEFNHMYQRLAAILLEYNIELAVRHVRGKDNELADALSRWERPFDDQDWQFDKSQFADLDRNLGPFDVDACCDLAGYNAHCKVFWTELDDCIKQTWKGKNIYCNPPFNNVLEILKHFLFQWSLDPYGTSATFVLPKWTWASWYHLREHFQCYRTYPKHSPLFTSPDWRAIATGASVDTRCYRGSTEWPVVVWHKPKLAPPTH